jgi:hypothetical protein
VKDRSHLRHAFFAPFKTACVRRLVRTRCACVFGTIRHGANRAPPAGRQPEETISTGSRMLEFKLLLATVVIGGPVLGIKKFDQHCAAKFGHAFFTKKTFYITVAALVLFFGGNLWRDSAVQNHGDAVNGIALMVLGTLVTCWLLYVNIKRTDTVCGIGGSVVQLAIFSALAWFWLPLMLLGLAWQFLLMTDAKPVYVVKRKAGSNR